MPDLSTCPGCGGATSPGDSFCPSCGASLGGGASAVSDEEYAAYIGKNADYYIRKFRKFTAGGGGGAGGGETFALTWHWPAFFFPVLWMLYRKMYVWALVAFLVDMVPGLGLVFMVVFGVTANYIYFRHVRARVFEARETAGPEGAVAELAASGGVNRWVFVLAAVIAVVIVMGTIAALTMAPEHADEVWY